MSNLLQTRVGEALGSLRLTTAQANLSHHLRAATERDLSILDVLDALFADEIAARQERSISVRTKLAHFPVSKTLDSFDFDAQPSLDRRIVKELQTLAFIDRAENVALLGPSGVGKTQVS